ncbi:MAG TPA: hypothetical protein VFF07_05025 [Actinomycetota bacterium]|nr:hypothetical protein [Actinomycetota bacterium]
MRPDILLKTLHDRRRALIGWSMGVLGITAMCVSLWPTIEEQAADFQKLIDNYPDALHFRYPGDHDSGRLPQHRALLVHGTAHLLGLRYRDGDRHDRRRGGA